MSAETPSVGIDHPTVVPRNFDGNDATGSDASTDASAGPRTESEDDS